MEAAIDNANFRVWLETYIFDDSDAVAGRIVGALKRAAKRGCDVVLIVDYIGSGGLVRWKKELTESNVHVVLFNPFPWSHWLDLTVPKSVGPIPFRDHRKLLIADNIGFCGSMNIQKEVLGEKDFSGSNLESDGGCFGEVRFFDITAKIKGPAVEHLANVFRDSLVEAGTGVVRGHVDAKNNNAKNNTQNSHHSYVQVLQSNVRRERKSIQKALASQIRESRHEVLVASSYFMPPGFLKRALLHSKRCKILVSGTTDFFPVPGDLLAQTHALSRFIGRDNTAVHLYSKSHMHAKFTVMDSVYVSLGSFNFDRFSARRNLEVAVGVFDKQVASRMESIHSALCSESSVASRDDSTYFRNPMARFVCWMAYLVMKTSGKNLFDGFDAYNHERSKVVREKLFFFERPDVLASSFPM